MNKLAAGMLITGMGICGCVSDTEWLNQQMRGQQAPDFDLESLDGDRVRLSEFLGKPVLLVFWAVG